MTKPVDDEADTPAYGSRRERRNSERMLQEVDLFIAKLEVQLGMIFGDAQRQLISQHFGRAMQIGMDAEKHKTLAVQKELDELRDFFQSRETLPPAKPEE